jgi:hypothetical protein
VVDLHFSNSTGTPASNPEKRTPVGESAGNRPFLQNGTLMNLEGFSMMCRSIVFSLAFVQTVLILPHHLTAGQHQEDPYAQYAWSKPVNGLRGRLVPLQQTFGEKETIKFRLQFQNVTDKKMVIVSPRLMPMIAPPDNHPFGGVAFDVVLTAQPVNGRVSIFWGQRAVLQSARDVSSLPPRGILQIDIQCPLKLREKKNKPTNYLPGRKIIKLEQEMPFVLRDAGKYEINGFFEYPRKNTNGDKKVADGGQPDDSREWRGRMELPKIVVEITTTAG